MGRLFTFGCSFTQYMWPTWAAIIGYDTEADMINYALPGLGNVAIHHRIIEADLKHKFTPEDKIMILWSSFSREDRFSNGVWEAYGSVFNAGCKYNNRKWLKEHWSMQNDLVKNMTAIITINKLYKNNITWQGHSFAPFANEAADQFDDSMEYAHLRDFYQSHIHDIPWQLFETSKPFKQLRDSHPDPLGHLDKVQNWIYPALGKELKQTTVDKIKHLQMTVQNYILQNNIVGELDEVYKYLDRLYHSQQFKDLQPYSTSEYPLENLHLG